MSQSLYTAMGGISAAQTDLNVISNNIANLNTTAFKSSSVNFSDVFSRTISSGSVSTQSTGGTNPIQVGVGVQVSAASKDFNPGSWIATGKPTDLMIEGSGFFTVESSDGEKYYTRAGDFSFDAKGYLVTSSGYKLMGTNNILSSTTTNSNVHVPTAIIATKAGNTAIGTQLVTNLNSCDSITSGAFNLTVNGSNTLTINLDTTTDKTMGDLATSIQDQIDAARDAAGTAATTATNQATNADTSLTLLPAVNTAFPADGVNRTAVLTNAATAKTTALTALHTGVMTQAQYDLIVGAADTVTANVPALGVNINQTQIDNITAAETIIKNNETAIAAAQTALHNEYEGIAVTCDASTGGTIKFGGIDGTIVKTLTFSNPTGMTATNFVTATGMNNAQLDTTDHSYSSKVLDWTVSVGQVTSSSLAASKPVYTINADGSIQAKYSNQDTLSVQLDNTGSSYEFLYTTSEGVSISGTKCTVDPNLANPSNFVIQMASITNTDGLLSVGSNLFKAGPNSGSILYSVGGKLGLGKIESGGLEASNVDLSKEFSNMIVAQRAVQANSRVFTTTSDIMNEIVSMGR